MTSENEMPKEIWVYDDGFDLCVTEHKPTEPDFFPYRRFVREDIAPQGRFAGPVSYKNCGDLTDDFGKCLCDACQGPSPDAIDCMRVREWALSKPRKDALLAFTAGPERDVARLFEEVTAQSNVNEQMLEALKEVQYKAESHLRCWDDKAGYMADIKMITDTAIAKAKGGGDEQSGD